MAEGRSIVRLKHSIRKKLVQLLKDSVGISERDALLGELSARLESVCQNTGRVPDELVTLAERLAALEVRARTAEERLEGLQALSAALLDDIPRLRRRLGEVRSDPGYDSVWDESEPLVTVRIATYNLAEVLVERALASVLSQTYERFEVIVVGDACTDDTEDRIRALGDHRIRFVNLPLRADYPEPPHRQLVAGAPCMNLAAQLAKGTWLAPLDDDDEFEPDHLAVLLATALEGRYELAYGNLRMFRPGQDEPEVYGKWPPTYGAFGYQAAVYLSALRFFEYDTRSWLLGEPADMTLRRRMVDAGVRMGWVDKVVTTYYPSLLHKPRRD